MISIPSSHSLTNQQLVNPTSKLLFLILWCCCLFAPTAFAQLSRPEGSISEVELASSADDMLPGANANWQQTTLPLFKSYRDTEQVANFLWLRFYLPHSANGETLGLFTARHMLNLDIYVNGQKLYSERSVNKNYLGWNTPLLMELQPGTLALARNEVVLALSKSAGSTYLNSLYVEPYVQAKTRYQAAHFLQVQMAFIGLITTLVLGALTFGLWMIHRQHIEYLYYCCCCFSWAVVMLYMYLPYPLWPDWVSWNFASNFCINLTAIALFAFVGRILKFKSKIWLQSLLALQVLGHITILALPTVQSFVLAYLLNFLSLLGAIVVSTKVVRILLQGVNPKASWIAAGLLAIVVFLGVDMVRYFVGISSGHGFEYTTLAQFSFPFTLIIFFIHLMTQYLKALQASEQLNLELVQRIQVATVELEQHFAERHQHELEESAQQERQKIYRDLHDDVGAKLTSILHSVDTSKQKQMARAALDSLRETIHHANYPGQTMQELLTTVSEEMQIRLQAAGLRFIEDSTVLSKDRSLSSAESYHLTRVLRELINNILNHAKAQEVHLQAQFQEREGFVITIRDNGCGFQAGLGAGNGLNNIKHRMQELGGRAQWRSSAGLGCTVELLLPC